MMFSLSTSVALQEHEGTGDDDGAMIGRERVFENITSLDWMGIIRSLLSERGTVAPQIGMPYYSVMPAPSWIVANIFSAGGYILCKNPIFGVIVELWRHIHWLAVAL